MPARIVAVARAVVLPTRLRDTFTGANDTPLENHTPDIVPGAAAWTEWTSADVPDGTIQSNQLRLVGIAQNVDFGYVIEHGVSNGVARLTFIGNHINPAWGGLAFRDDGVDRWWVRQAAATNLAALIDPNSVTQDSAALTSSINDEIYFLLTLDGANISCIVTNITTSQSIALSAVSAENQSATKHGVYMQTKWNNGLFDRYDDYLFEG